MMLLVGACARAGADDRGVTGRLNVVLAPQVPEFVMKHLSDRLPKNLFCRAHFSGLESGREERDPGALAAELALSRGKNDMVIAVVVRKGDLTFREHVDVPGGVAILNIAPLLPDDTASKESRDLFVWRVEKQVTRLGALLAGLESCPFPLCALSESRTIADVDTKGRNLCPPCQIKLEKTMNDKGLHLPPTNEAPFFLPEDK